MLIDLFDASGRRVRVSPELVEEYRGLGFSEKSEAPVAPTTDPAKPIVPTTTDSVPPVDPA